MNIFEQYGIKEVADVTLYAIETDKYDDEIYIPVMYFDTLKVSTIEQTAEQTSARGGLGNSELIIWDYGKEISVTLEDALYTPASQSLMWGGKFGTKNSKIWGVWNPFIYPRDRYGREVYLKRVEYSFDNVTELELLLESKGIQVISIEKIDDKLRLTYIPPLSAHSTTVSLTEKEFVSKFSSYVDNLSYVYCPCSESYKIIGYVQNQGRYKYYKINTMSAVYDQLNPVNETCPRDLKICEENDISTLIDFYDETSIEPADKWKNSDRPELAYITMDNFGKYEYKEYAYSPVDDHTDEYCYYKELEICDTTDSYPTQSCSGTTDVYGYFWDKSDLKMTSTQGDQDTYYIENASVRYRVPTGNTNKEIMISQEGIFHNYCTQLLDKYEVTNYTDEDLLFDATDGLVYKYKPYSSLVRMYTNKTYEVVSEDGTGTTTKTVRVLVGTFYIIYDWNVSNYSPEDMIHPLNSGLEQVQVLDRMEKCKATQTFAIDATRNIRMNNYRELPEYANSELTVYIDPKTMKPFESNASHYVRKNGDVLEGSFRIIKQYEVYYKWTRTIAPDYTTLGHQIIVDATHFPGSYKLVGETYARSRDDGKDERFQFEIPLCKMASDTSLTLEAAGDPTTFTMNLKVLRPESGEMMRLTQYDVECNTYDGYSSGSTKVVPTDGVIDSDPVLDDEVG